MLAKDCLHCSRPWSAFHMTITSLSTATSWSPVTAWQSKQLCLHSVRDKMVGTSYTLLSNTSAHKHSCARSDKNGAKDLTTCRAGSLCTIFVFVFFFVCLGVVVFFFWEGGWEGFGRVGLVFLLVRIIRERYNSAEKSCFLKNVVPCCVI